MYIITKRDNDSGNINVICNPGSGEIEQFDTLDEAEYCAEKYGFLNQDGVSIEDSSILEN